MLSYFTETGNQVVLLSQPDEVRGEYLSQISPKLLRVVHLEHEEITDGVGRSTAVEAALMAHAGEVDAAAAELADAFAASPDVALLRAGLAIEKGDCYTRESLINAALDACGLEPVRRPDPPTPLSVRNVTTTTGRRIEGPLASVIMAIRDVLSFIDATLGSVLGQTWRNLELLGPGSNPRFWGSNPRCFSIDRVRV